MEMYINLLFICYMDEEVEEVNNGGGGGLFVMWLFVIEVMIDVLGCNFGVVVGIGINGVGGYVGICFVRLCDFGGFDVDVVIGNYIGGFVLCSMFGGMLRLCFLVCVLVLVWRCL